MSQFDKLTTRGLFETVAEHMSGQTFDVVLDGGTEDEEKIELTVDEAIVGGVILALGDVIYAELEQGVPVSIPGICKLTPRVTAPRKAGWGTVPFTGEEKWMEAKPANITLKATPAASLSYALPSARSTIGKKLVEIAAKASRARKRAAAAREREEAAVSAKKSRTTKRSTSKRAARSRR